MKKKILIVDDKDVFRIVVKSFLSGKYDVETAENGSLALALLKQGYMPDAIVSDLMMPVLDGKSLLRQIKSDNELTHIPVLILSSIDKSSERIELMKSGAGDYLMKPFNPEELEIRIENLLGRTA